MDETDTREPAPEDDLVVDRRSRRAFTISLAIVALVVAVGLGYSFFRDPGPQPTYPPKITGTDDGGLKRAIVHYLGALESGDVDDLTGVMKSDSARSKALATIAIEEFGDAADGEATVVVRDSEDFGGLKFATVTFANGSKQEVDFSTSGPGDPWIPSPRTDRPLPEADTGDGPPPTTPSAAPTG